MILVYQEQLKKVEVQQQCVEHHHLCIIIITFIRAPEICLGGEYNEKADVWALGITLYQMVALAPPFPLLPFELYVIQILILEPTKLPDDTPKDIKDLIDVMLIKDDKQRLDVETLFSLKSLRVAAFKEYEKVIGSQKIEYTREINRLNTQLKLTQNELERVKNK